jgi:hypothetical protein
MVGNIYVNAPVISNIITTTDTVICMIPLSAAPAPRKAYVPGVIHGTSGSQAAKNAESGKDSWRCCTKMPTIRPKDAPMAMDGTKIPAGTLHPKEMITSSVRRMVAMAREKIICQRLSRLYPLAVRVKTDGQLTRKAHHSHGLLRTPRRESPCFQSCRS